MITWTKRLLVVDQNPERVPIRNGDHLPGQLTGLCVECQDKPVYSDQELLHLMGLPRKLRDE